MGRLGVLLLASLILVAACGGGSDTAPAGDALPAPQEFSEVAEVVDALNQAGLACGEFRILETDFDTLKEFGLCYVPDGGEVDIYLFEGTMERDQWRGSFEGTVEFNIGGNWIITANEPDRTRLVAETLGGEVIAAEDEPGDDTEPKHEDGTGGDGT